jgi:small GTP-binding protein
MGLESKRPSLQIQAMVLFNYSTKELTAKVVYYGAGLCGKTTNLQWIHEQLPIKNKGKMLSLATEADRTLFFDFLPIELGTIRGMKTRVQLYTVPGQVFYNATRRMVLKGADCVIFVADSQDAMIDANSDAMRNLRENLVANELDPDTIPLVIQYNKRDLPNAAPLDELNRVLNTRGAPWVEAAAKSGKGVEETLKVATQLVFRVLASKYGSDAAVAVPRATGAVPVVRAAPPVAPLPPPVAAAPFMPPPRVAPPPRPPGPLLDSTDELLEALGGPAPVPAPPIHQVAAPPLVDEDEEEIDLDLGPTLSVPEPAEDPLAALSGSDEPRAEATDPFGPEFSLENLGGDAAAIPTANTSELDLELAAPPPQTEGSDPFGSGLDSPFDDAPESPTVPPPALDDPFASALEPAIPADVVPALGGSSSFTADPVSVEAVIDIPSGTLTATPVTVHVPVEITISSGDREILVPIRLQLKVRIR